MLARRPQAIAFDCYGTLLDVTEEDFIAACGRILRRHELEHDHRSFWETWLAASRTLAKEHGVDPEALHEEAPAFIPYRERWPQTFTRAFADAGLSADAVAAYEAFHDTLCRGVAYPDTLAALERLRPHFRIAVVSNADDDHLMQALTENGLTRAGLFDFILSSESARSYKPRRRIFEDAAARFDLHVADVLYVGDSPIADVLGARTAGMSVAWLNRLGAERPERVPEPDIEVGDLVALADVLLGSAAPSPGRRIRQFGADTVVGNSSELAGGGEAGGGEEGILAADVGGAEEGGERHLRGGALG
jgi:2-haloalkanoic acid dehalogenase type II